MRWLRLYTDILDDPKLAKLSDGEYRMFINLLAIACEQDKEGHIYGTFDEIAWRMRNSTDNLSSAIVKLKELNILASNHESIVFTHWSERQFKSDVSTDRWRRFYDKRKEPKENRIEQNRTDTDTARLTDRLTNVCKSSNDDQTFDTFWRVYPKKVGKEAARRAWKKIRSPKETLEKIILALTWQRESDQWTSERGRFIPNPGTYLNQGRWEDEPDGNQGYGRVNDNLFLRTIREEGKQSTDRSLDSGSKPISRRADSKSGSQSDGGVRKVSDAD